MKRAWSLPLCFSLAACGGEARPDETTVEDSVVAAPDTCDASMLAWSDPASQTTACEGPWEYSRYNTCSMRAPECGAQDQCIERQCQDFSFGVQGYHADTAVVPASPGFSVPTLSEPPVCTTDSQGRLHCGKPTRIADYDYAEAHCNSEASTRRTAVLNQLRAQGLRPADESQLVIASVTLSITGTAGNYHGRCTVVLHVPDKKLGRSSVDGANVCPTTAPCTAYGYPRCTFAGPSCGIYWSRLYSAPGLTAAELVTSEPGLAPSPAPACTSCDPLPIGTAAEARAKLACIRGRLAGPLNEKSSDPEIRERLLRRAMLLYELRADALNPDDRAALRSLYDGSAVEPACAPVSALLPPDTCPGKRPVFSGGVVESLTPRSVEEGALLSNLEIRAFRERASESLATPIAVDAVAPGTYTSSYPGGAIPAATVADVYLLHMQTSFIAAAVSGSITFDTDILGVITTDARLSQTDASLGSPATAYPTGLTTRGLTSEDTVTISADRRTLTVALSEWYTIDELRVLVAATPKGQPNEVLSRESRRCQRLALPHVPPAVAYVELESCLSPIGFALGLDPTVEASCTSDQAARGAVISAEDVMTNAMGALADDTSPFASLPRALYTVDRWYGVASSAELALSGTSTAARPALGRILGRFWRYAYDGGGTTDDLLTATDLDTALLTSSSRALEVDRAVLTAAFTYVTSLPAISVEGTVVMPETTVLNTPVLSGDALLALAGDGTRGLVTRLRDLSLFHDFARRFSGAGPVETEISTLWALLAALPDHDRLAGVVASAGTASGWRAVFAQIASQQTHLTSALEAGSPFDLTLLANVSEAEERRASYLATGFLDPNRRNTLHAGLDQKIRSNVISFMQSAANDLDDEISDYRADLATVVGGVIAQAGTQAALDRIDDQKRQRAAEIDDLQSDLAGLMQNAAREEARFANIVYALEDVEAAIDGAQYISLPDSELFELSGADALWTQQLSTIDQVSAHAFIGLEPGQILSVRTTGRWSPTCSIRGVRIFDPNTGTAAPVALTQPETGPEGFTVSYVNNHYETHSHSYTEADEYSRSYGWKAEVCANAKFGFLTDPLEIGLSASACGFAGQTWSYSETTSDTDSDGGGVQTSASFSGGLRLPNTPFPRYPAGALLAVVLPTGDLSVSHALDVYVVREGGTAIMIPEQADVHLVVNDLGTCAALDDTNRLTVTAQRLISATALSEAVVTTMGTELAGLRLRIPELASQGTVLPSQSSQIRSEAINNVEIASGVPYASLPSPLVGLFNAFLDSELVRLERAVQIRSIERRMDGIALELQAMDDDLENLGIDSRLAQILPSMAVRNLDGDRLRAKSNRLVDVSLDYLYPIMDLWYPDALLAMNADISIGHLLHANVETRLIDLVSDVQSVIDDALLSYQVADLGYQEWQQRPVVAVSFVRPDFVPGPFDPASPWRKADPVRAESVWQAIEADGMGTFTIDANDVYSALGGDGVLGCGESVPVIHRMAIFVARPNQTNNEDLNTRGRWLPGSAAEADVFVRAAGNTTYFLDDGLGQSLSIPIIHGEPDEALELFHNLPRPERLVGLSPFTHFDVNFAALAQLRAQPGNEDGFRQLDPFTGEETFVATEVMLVMELDSRGVGAPMQGVDVCRP